MGNLGPIDPSVANIFNPANPLSPGQLAPISVEDVSAFFKLVKDEVGINHEDELIQALAALTEKVHPLALGNVQRSHHQARMMARKLLKLHMVKDAEEHEISQLIENLKSNLFYHGHPINRKEAKDDLKLKVVDAPPDLEALMWKLYLEYEAELRLNEAFNPIHELELKLQAQGQAPGQGPVTTQQILIQMQQLAANGLGLGGQFTEQQLVNIAAAMVPWVQGGGGATAPGRRATLDPIPGVVIESVAMKDVYKTDLRVERAQINTPAGPQDGIKQEVLWQRWERET